MTTPPPPTTATTDREVAAAPGSKQSATARSRGNLSAKPPNIAAHRTVGSRSGGSTGEGGVLADVHREHVG